MDAHTFVITFKDKENRTKAINILAQNDLDNEIEKNLQQICTSSDKTTSVTFTQWRTDPTPNPTSRPQDQLIVPLKPPPQNTHEALNHQVPQQISTWEKKGPDVPADHNKKDTTQTRPQTTNQKLPTTQNRPSTVNQATVSMERKDTPGQDSRKQKQLKNKHPKPRISNTRNIG